MTTVYLDEREVKRQLRESKKELKIKQKQIDGLIADNLVLQSKLLDAEKSYLLIKEN